MRATTVKGCACDADYRNFCCAHAGKSTTLKSESSSLSYACRLGCGSRWMSRPAPPGVILVLPHLRRDAVQRFPVNPHRIWALFPIRSQGDPNTTHIPTSSALMLAWAMGGEGRGRAVRRTAASNAARLASNISSFELAHNASQARCCPVQTWKADGTVTETEPCLEHFVNLAQAGDIARCCQWPTRCPATTSFQRTKWLKPSMVRWVHVCATAVHEPASVVLPFLSSF